MTPQGDTKRPHSVKLEIDPHFCATSQAGAVLVEQTLRALGLRKILKQHLPARSALAQFAAHDFAYAAIAALLLGGDGINVLEPLRADGELRKIFGLAQAASDATSYRILCALAGLPQREHAEAYAPAGPTLERLDMFGGGFKPAPVHRRLVPETPEAAAPAKLRALRRAERALARKCLNTLGHKLVRLHGWTVLFGDGSDLAVDGRCFDAARLGREGEQILRWLTLRVGPVLVDQLLLAGNADEGRSLPGMLRRARPLLCEACGTGRLLALLDAAYCEGPVIKALPNNCDWIVCANQHRGLLTRLAGQQPEAVWRASGADAARGWEASGVCLMTHQFEGWSAPVTIAVRRWREAGELPGVWHYSFLASNLEPAALPRELTRGRGAAAALWLLYGTKQGRENHFKTPLRCLSLHHPPSGRLGVSQAYYALASMAANVAMVLRYAVAPRAERGMTLERMRRCLFGVAGYVVRSGRRLVVRLAGAALDALRQGQLLEAWANARRL
jgi:hypothetical protein